MEERDSIFIEKKVITKDRPTVVVEGKKKEPLSTKVKIEGKTLDVYYFLLEQEGFHGVREIQRVMGYSSPSLAIYHLKKLVDARAVIRNEHGQYGIKKDEVKLGSMKDHVKFLAFWIPRIVIVFGIMMLLGILGLFYLIMGLDFVVFNGILVATCILIAALLFFDIWKMVYNYKHERSEISYYSQTELKQLFSRGLILIKSDRAKDRFEAQKIFENIITKDKQKSVLSLLALLNLCNLLLDELKLHGKQEVLMEVLEISSKLYHLSAEQNSTSLTVETLLLQHKFDLVQGKLDIARDKLEEALILADKEGMANLKKKIILEINSYEEQIEGWINPIGLSLKQRIEQTRLENYISNAITLINEREDFHLK
ncbi:MAG: hypothetical protein ACXACY_22920 [Candidatus Hodarchaeales archaeon]|jgi:hypothetical protein